MDDYQWEKRELPPLEPLRTPKSGRQRRSGTEEFTQEELDFISQINDAGFADRPVRKGKTKVRSNLDALQQAVQPLPPVQGVPQRPRTATPRRPPSQLRILYTADKLKELKKATDRGSFIGIGKGIGDFEDVIKAATKFSASGAGDEAQACRVLVKQLTDYLTDDRRKDYEAELAKRAINEKGEKGEKADKRTILKHETAERMLLEARRLQEDAVDKRHPDRASDDPGIRTASLPNHAADMAQTFGMKKASGGTSDVRLIPDSAGKVAYAFKSIDGESDQTFLPTGGAAVREAMCSFVAEAIKVQSKGLLDFGAPTAVIATLNDEQAVPKMGALVEGISGTMADPEGVSKDYAKGNQSEAETKAYQEAMKASLALSRKVPAKELNKVLLCNLAMANYDIKWGNMIVVEGPNGELTARPFDGGAAFPTDNFVQKKGLLDGTTNPGGALLMDAISGIAAKQELAAARQPMDPSLVQPFLDIDVDALERSVKAERQRLLQTHGLDDDLLDDKAIGRSLKSIRAIQAILTKDRSITMADFVAAYNGMLADIVA
jgi:hypothetical protein